MPHAKNDGVNTIGTNGIDASGNIQTRSILRRTSRSFQEPNETNDRAASASLPLSVQSDVNTAANAHANESRSWGGTALESTAFNTTSSSSLRSSRQHLRWDEETIRLHDAERGTRMKIDEPKTPFTYYDSSGEELDQGSVNPSDLAKALANTSEWASGRMNKVSTSDNNLTHGASDNRNIKNSNNIINFSPSNLQEQAFSSFPDMRQGDDMKSFNTEGNMYTHRSTTFSDDIPDMKLEDSEEEIQRRRDFDEKRAAHYNMKEALQRARWKREHSKVTKDDESGDDEEKRGKGADRDFESGQQSKGSRHSGGSSNKKKSSSHREKEGKSRNIEEKQSDQTENVNKTRRNDIQRGEAKGSLNIAVDVNRDVEMSDCNECDINKVSSGNRDLRNRHNEKISGDQKSRSVGCRNVNVNPNHMHRDKTPPCQHQK